VIEISPSMMSALQAEKDSRAVPEFAAWWQRAETLLGAKPDDRVLAAMLGEGRQFGATLGLGPDDDPERFYFCALYRALMPNPSGNQYLLATDVIFDDAPVAERITALLALSRTAA
jgi:hypothetical protein